MIVSEVAEATVSSKAVVAFVLLTISVITSVVVTISGLILAGKANATAMTRATGKTIGTTGIEVVTRASESVISTEINTVVIAVLVSVGSSISVRLEVGVLTKSIFTAVEHVSASASLGDTLVEGVATKGVAEGIAEAVI